MFQKRIEEIVLTLCVTIGFSACANRTVNTVTDSSAATPAMEQEAQLATSEGAHVVSRIQFDKGRTVLTPAAQTELNHAIEQARQMGKVDKVTIAVWSDVEYPLEEKKVSKVQLDIADKRGQEIENYFERNFNISDVQIHNMGKQPNAMARVFDSSDARLKEKLEAQKSASNDKGLFDNGSRVSSALVMVEVE